MHKSTLRTKTYSSEVSDFHLIGFIFDDKKGMYTFNNLYNASDDFCYS